MKKIMKKTASEHKHLAKRNAQSRKELEKRVIEGAKLALKDYKKVFERLAEYDRAGKI
jgi:hypothetical protein